MIEPGTMTFKLPYFIAIIPPKGRLLRTPRLEAAVMSQVEGYSLPTHRAPVSHAVSELSKGLTLIVH